MNRLLEILLPIFLLTGCIQLIPDDGMGQAVFTIRTGTTITGDDSGETAVRRWAVMMFDIANPDAWYYAVCDGGGDITCVARKGRAYRAYAIVNYQAEGDGMFAPSSISGENDLLAFEPALASNSGSSLVMFGSTNLTQLPQSGVTAIPITRLCSKVSVQKITVDMSDPVYAAKQFTLNAVYLTNAYTRSTLYGDSEEPSDESEYWYNAMSWHGSGTVRALDDMLGDRGIGADIANGSSYTTAHSFYTYPNAISSDDDRRVEEWCARCTRLVIEGTLGGKKYYYAVSIPSMKRNFSYVITEAVIRKPGSLDPEEDIPGIMDVNISISENTWDSNYYISENS